MYAVELTAPKVFLDACSILERSLTRTPAYPRQIEHVPRALHRRPAERSVLQIDIHTSFVDVFVIHFIVHLMRSALGARRS